MNFHFWEKNVQPWEKSIKIPEFGKMVNSYVINMQWSVSQTSTGNKEYFFRQDPLPTLQCQVWFLFQELDPAQPKYRQGGSTVGVGPTKNWWLPRTGPEKKAREEIPKLQWVKFQNWCDFPKEMYQLFFNMFKENAQPIIVFESASQVPICI